MIQIVNGKVSTSTGYVSQIGKKQNQTGMGTIFANSLQKPKPGPDLSGKNKDILKGLGIDLDTVLTPKGSRKKRAGLRGGDTEELSTTLGE